MPKATPPMAAVRSSASTTRPRSTAASTARSGPSPTSGAAFSAAASRNRPRNLAHALVAEFSRRIQAGLLEPGDKLPAEAAIMGEFGVSRTVVREALSMLQASHFVVTRHGIGTFVAAAGGSGQGFRIAPDQLATLHEVIALLELRIALESETASLAAQRRKPENLRAMREALDAMSRAVDAGEPGIEPDFRFHLEIARATQNAHFTNLMQALSTGSIPRARLNETGSAAAREHYLRYVQAEHEGIFNAIAEGDAETARAMMRLHLANSRDRHRRAAALAEGRG